MERSLPILFSILNPLFIVFCMTTKAVQQVTKGNILRGMKFNES
jgi:hypothetical protein